MKHNISISIAESCSGGLLSATITAESGVSKVFNMGIVAYSNKAKTKLLKINKKILKKHGEVSYQIALLMAKNLQKISKSKLCISTTGVAGPSGGTKNKPVGLVFIGIYYKNKINVIEKKFIGSRNQIQSKTIKSIGLSSVLNWLMKCCRVELDAD